MCVEGGNILLLVNSCTSRPQYISILWNIKFVYFLPNCTTLLQDLDLGITKYFQQLYRKHMVQKAASILDSEKDVTTEIKCSASNISQSWALATYEPNTEDYVLKMTKPSVMTEISEVLRMMSTSHFLCICK